MVFGDDVGVHIRILVYGRLYGIGHFLTVIGIVFSSILLTARHVWCVVALASI